MASSCSSCWGSSPHLSVKLWHQLVPAAGVRVPTSESDLADHPLSMEVAIVVIVVFVVLFLAIIAVARLCSKFKLVKCCDSDVESLDEEDDDDDTDDGDTKACGQGGIRDGDEEEGEDEEGEVCEDMGPNLQGTVAQYDDEDDQEVHIAGCHLSMEMEADEYIINKLEESLL